MEFCNLGDLLSAEKQNTFSAKLIGKYFAMKATSEDSIYFIALIRDNNNWEIWESRPDKEIIHSKDLVPIRSFLTSEGLVCNYEETTLHDCPAKLVECVLLSR